MVFSFRGRRKDGFLQQLYQILRRTVILFGFGLFIISNDSCKLVVAKVSVGVRD